MCVQNITHAASDNFLNLSKLHIALLGAYYCFTSSLDLGMRQDEISPF